MELNETSNDRTIDSSLNLLIRHPNEYSTFQGISSKILSDEGQSSLKNDELNNFLDLNKEVIINPLIFKAQDFHKILDVNLKEISIRHILYTDVTPNNVRDATEVASILGLDEREVLRIIVQTCRKFPEKVFQDENHNLNSIPAESSEKSYRSQRLVFYCDSVLNERRIVAYICLYMISNRNPTSEDKIDLFNDAVDSTDYAIKRIDAIENLMRNLVDYSHHAGLSEELHSMLLNDNILFTIISFKILIHFFDVIPKYDKQVVRRWFEVMEYFKHANELAPYIKDKEHLIMIKAYTSCISFQMLVGTKSEFLDLNSYFYDMKLIREFNLTITNLLNSDAILEYTWLTVLQKKISLLQSSESTTSKANDNENCTMADYLKDSQVSLTKRQLEFNLFEELQKVQKYVCGDHLLEEIAGLILDNALSVIKINLTTSYYLKEIPYQDLKDDLYGLYCNAIFKDALSIAREKFPILIATYVNLSTIGYSFYLSTINLNLSLDFSLYDIKEMKTYATIFERSIFSKFFEVNDKDSSVISLKDSIDVHPPYETNKELSFRFEKGSRATHFPLATGDMVVFAHKYNGWVFLGRTLENLTNDFDNWDQVKVEVILSILGAMKVNIGGLETSQIPGLISSMSRNLNASDILDVLFDLWEKALVRKNVDICKTIVMIFLLYSRAFDFERIWSFLLESSLLSDEVQEGSALSILTLIEGKQGEYEFTFDLLYFLGDLMSDKELGTRSRVVSKILNYSIAVYQNLDTLHFSHNYGKMNMLWWIVWGFDIFIDVSYKLVDDTSTESSMIEDTYLLGSEIIEKYFLTSSKNSTDITSPIMSLLDSFNQNAKDLDNIPGIMSIHNMSIILLFYRRLISIRSLKDMEPSALERAFFEKLPTLVLLYARRVSCRIDILYLLISLLSSNWKENERPSMLNHLGPFYSLVLLNSLASDLEDPFVSHEQKIAIYTFVSSVFEIKKDDLEILFEGKGNLEKLVEYLRFKNSVSFPDILERRLDDIRTDPYLVSFCLMDAISHCADSWLKVNGKVFDLMKKILFALNYVDSKVEDVNILSRIRLRGQLLQVLAFFLTKTENYSHQKAIVYLLKSDEILPRLQWGVESHEIVGDIYMDSSKKRFYQDEKFPPFLYKKTYDIFDDNSYENARLYETRATETLLAILDEK